MAIKVGIMSLAHLHADSYAHCLLTNPRAEFVGLADHDPERAARKAEQYGVRCFESYEALLESGIEAVLICSENVRHHPLALMAARAGKHILCEKPLATRVADGQAMIDACREAGVLLFTAFPCRFSPAMARLKALVEAGEVGEVLALRGTNRGWNPLGWFNDPELAGGGAMMDHTVHVADLMRWLLKAEVEEVYAEIGNNMYHAGYEDTAMLTLTFTNGVFATLDSSWSRPRTFPTWGDVTLAVIGTKGIIEMDLFAQYMTYYDDKSGRVRQLFWGDNLDYQMVEEFLRAIEGEEVSILATGEDGVRAVEVAIAGYESARQGAPVKLER